MIVWLILIAGSLAIGYFFGLRSEIKGSWYYAIAVPWLVLLVAILITEYVVPYQGGGASMWLVAQFFGGTIAGYLGAVGHGLGKKKANKNTTNNTDHPKENI